MSKRQLTVVWVCCVLVFAIIFSCYHFKVELEMYLTIHPEDWQKHNLDYLIDKTTETILLRLKAFGIHNPTLNREGQNIIVKVKVPKKDVYLVRGLITKRAILEFKLAKEEQIKLKNVLEERSALIEKKALLTGDYLTTAKVKCKVKFITREYNFDKPFLLLKLLDAIKLGKPFVWIKFNKEGAQKFSKLTSENVGRRLAIIFDGEIISVPYIKEPIPSGEAVILGKFSLKEAHALAIVLRFGKLSLPISVRKEVFK